MSETEGAGEPVQRSSSERLSRPSSRIIRSPPLSWPGLIASIDAALRGLAGRAPTAAEAEKPTPAVMPLTELADGRTAKAVNKDENPRTLAREGRSAQRDRETPCTNCGSRD